MTANLPRNASRSFRLFVLMIAVAIAAPAGVEALAEEATPAEPPTLSAAAMELTFDPATAAVVAARLDGKTSEIPGGLELYNDSRGGERLTTREGSFAHEPAVGVSWTAADASDALTASVQVSARNDGLFWTLKLSNAGEKPTKVRVRLILPVLAEGPWTWFDGRNEHPSSQLMSWEPPPMQHLPSGVTGFGAAYDAASGVLVGMNNDQPISVYGSGLWTAENRLRLGYEVRLVVPPQRSITRELLCKAFDAEFGCRSAVDAYWSALPENHNLPDSIDPAIWGPGGSLVSWVIFRDYPYMDAYPEAADMVRRFRMGWDWFYRGLPFMCDFALLEPALQERGVSWRDLRNAYREAGASPPIPDSSNENIAQAVRERIDYQRQRYEFASELDVIGLYYNQPRTNEGRIVDLLFPDARFEGPFAFGERHIWTLGSSYGKLYASLAGRLIEKLPVGGMGVDSANGNLFYTGPAIENVLEICGYDDSGRIVALEGAAQNVIFRGWKQQARQDGREVLPIIANVTEFATVPVAATVSGSLNEACPLGDTGRGDGLWLRFMLGRKPITFWEDYTLRGLRLPGVDWDALDAGQTRERLVRYVREMNALCFRVGGYPGMMMLSGVPQLGEYTKILVHFNRDLGIEAIPAVKSDRPDAQLSRWGRGLGAAVAATSSEDRGGECTLNYHSRYFRTDENGRIAWADHFGQTPIRQTLGSAITGEACGLAGFTPRIRRAVAEIVAEDETPLDLTARMHLAPGEEGRIALAFDAPAKPAPLKLRLWRPAGYAVKSLRLIDDAGERPLEHSAGEGCVETDFELADRASVILELAPRLRVEDVAEYNAFLETLKARDCDCTIDTPAELPSAPRSAAGMWRNFAALQHNRAEVPNFTAVPQMRRSVEAKLPWLRVFPGAAKGESAPPPAAANSPLGEGVDGRAFVEDGALTLVARDEASLVAMARLLLDRADRRIPFCGYVSSSHRGGLYRGSTSGLLTERLGEKLVLTWDDPYFPYPSGEDE